MKVIDLLNKIANGEEVPKEIKIYMGGGRVAPFALQDEEYLNHYTGQSLIECLNEFNLNDKIKIIEEKKEIEELSFKDIAISINETYNDNVDVLMNKINELVKAVNELKNKE